jgi:hypothetical protein
MLWKHHREEGVSTQGVRECPHDYAVVWRTGDAPSSSGRLELGADELVLQASREPEGFRIPLDELSSVEIGRGVGERINGEKSLVLERHSCERVLRTLAIPLDGRKGSFGSSRRQRHGGARSSPAAAATSRARSFSSASASSSCPSCLAPDPSSAASVTPASSFLGWPYFSACALALGRRLPVALLGDLPADTDRQAHLARARSHRLPARRRRW